ncbi:MAG: YceI family protein [Thermodesulfobacteriota bacterium]
MKTALSTILTALLLGALLAAPAGAEVPAWSLDTAHSNFFFDVRHIFSSIRGSFPEYSGSIRFDPANPGASSVRLEIEVASVETGVAKRDGHLRSDDFFAASTYPRMTFASTAITRTGEQTFDIAGRLTIKDVTREVVLPVVFHPGQDHPMDPRSLVAGLEGQLTIDRLSYHVGDGKFFRMGVVGREVKILVSLELLRQK